MTKSVFAVLGAVVISLAIVGGYFYPKFELIAVGSPAGTTFTTAKVGQIDISPSTAAATTTSVLNNDASDRYVTNVFAACGSVGTSRTFLTGAGLAAWALQAATTSISGQGLQGNTNYIVNGNLSTSTADLFTMGTSTGLSSSYLTRWAAGSYMTFLFNATNTAACTVGVNYLAS